MAIPIRARKIRSLFETSNILPNRISLIFTADSDKLSKTMAKAILDEKNTANAASVFTFPLCMSFNNISDAIIEIVMAVSVGRNFK